MSYLSWLIAGLLMLGGCSRDSNSYDDCVLESMKGVSSDVAAAAIRKACRAKFPAVTQESVELPAEARKKIHGQAGMRANDTFGGTIYNGNADWTVTQVTIRLTPNGSDDQLLAADARDYNVDIAIQPLTSLDFSFNVGLSAHHNFAWKVSSSKGRFDPSKRQPVQTNQ